jgi:hypothetical protein
MVTDAHARTLKLLTEKKAEVEKVAKLLLEKEVITREDMRTRKSVLPIAEKVTDGSSLSAWSTTFPDSR